MAGLAVTQDSWQDGRQDSRAEWSQGVVAPVPKSFVERGVVVAYTTPLLATSRVRTDARGRLELIMPNVVDGRGVYVVPWAALPELAAPTVHDRMLQHEIVRTAAIHPESIRLAQLRIASRGFAGVDGVEPAMRGLGADERLTTAVNLALLVRLMHEGGLTSDEALQAALGGRSAEFKHALESVAARVGIDAATLADRTASLARAVAPFGLPEPLPAGRLRRLIHRLEEFRDSLTARAAAEGGEPGEIAEHCAAVAGYTGERCRDLLAAVDRRTSDIVPTLRAWPRDLGMLGETRERLAWLLDGWRRAIALWLTVPALPRAEQIVALGTIFHGLPLLPAEADSYGMTIDLGHAHRRLMRRHARLFAEGDRAHPATEMARRAERANIRAERL